MNCERVVLFGSSGFVGSHVAEALALSTGSRRREVVSPPWPAVDMSKPETLRGVIQAGDVVVNAAGYANATDTTAEGRALLQSANVDGVRNLAEAAVEAGAAQLLHISSVAAMGRLAGEGITEEMSGPITSPYAQSKLDGERVLAQYMDRLPVTMLRPTSVFGEGRGLAVTLCKLVARGVVPLPNGGSALIPFTYIGNVAKAVELSVGNENCYGRTFIVGDQRSYSLGTIVRQIGRAIGTKVRILPVPAAIALAGVLLLEVAASARRKPPILDRFRLDTLTHSVSYSINAFEQASGFVQPYGFEQAIDRIGKWYLAQRGK
jgi:dihydroflavonol-4-reductase